MKILMVAWDSGGGVEVTESVVQSCVVAGHQVRVLGTEGLRQRMEGAGATFVVYRHAPDNDRRQRETDILKDWEARNAMDSFARIRDRVMFGPAKLFCRDVAEELARERADLVVVDVLIASALCAVEAAGIPRVVLVHALYGTPRVGATPMGAGFLPAENPFGHLRDTAVFNVTMNMLRSGLSPLNEARAELGLYPYESPVELFDVADRIIACTSPSFDFEAASAPGNVVYVGPQSDGMAPGDWDNPWADQPAKPLVLVSLSSTFMEQSELLQQAADALGQLPVHGLITTGPTVEPSAIVAPPNVEVRSWVRHADVLPACAAVVSHGGHGTVLKTLAAGVPLVVVPMGRDQPDNAIRVVHAQAGIQLKGKVTSKRLEAAVRQVLEDPSYGAAAAVLATEIAVEHDDGLLVRELEAAAQGLPPTVRRRRSVASSEVATPLELPGDLIHQTIPMSDGGTIEVVIRPGSGPTVVFLHGMGLSAEIWAKQFAGLPPHYRLVAWDQRNCGASSIGEEGVGLARLVEDLISVLDAVDVRGGLLVGHSLGGIIAIEAALTHGDRLAERIDGLVLAATTGGTVPAVGSGEVKGAIFETIMGAEERWHISTRAPGFLYLSVRMSFGPKRPGVAERALMRRLLSVAKGSGTEMMTLLSTYDARDRLDQVALPVVVAAGTRDNYLPVSHARRLAEGLPRAEFASFTRAGHLLMLEKPQGFNSLLCRAAEASAAAKSDMAAR